MKKIHKSLINFFRPIEKRVRFVISAAILTGFMLFTTFFFFDKVWLFLPIFLLLTYALTYFSILEGIEKHEWTMLFLMPLCVTAAFYLFYFLFPVRWLTRLPFILFYAFSIYAILLTSNIFNVGVEKSLQLHRAAFSVNYFFQTFIVFLFTSVLLSFKLNFALNGLIMFLMLLPLSIQLLWSLKPKTTINTSVLQFSFLTSLLVSQIGMVLSFLPVRTTVFALFITACYYSLSGLIYHYVDQRLFKQTVREYIFVIGFVCIILILSIQW